MLQEVEVASAILRLVEPFVPLTLPHPASLRASRAIHVSAFAGMRLTHALARRRRPRGVTPVVLRLAGLFVLLHSPGTGELEA